MADKEKKYYIPDYEAGGYNEVSKKTFEAIHSAKQQFMSNFVKGNKKVGKIIITSTVADNSTGEDFKKMWSQNN